MATSYKVLGQVNPTANTLSRVYNVPASNSAVISTVVICNQSTIASSFKLAVMPSGNTVSSKHYLNYDTPIPGNDSIAVTIGITLAANDTILANASSSNISISVFGSEIY
jgi:hypothetical protein